MFTMTQPINFYYTSIRDKSYFIIGNELGDDPDLNQRIEDVTGKIFEDLKNQGLRVLYVDAENGALYSLSPKYRGISVEASTTTTTQIYDEILEAVPGITYMGKGPESIATTIPPPPPLPQLIPLQEEAAPKASLPPAQIGCWQQLAQSICRFFSALWALLKACFCPI